MTLPQRDYVYDAVVLKVQAGDSVRLDLDLGCSTHRHEDLRLSGYDSAGRYSPEGKAATAALTSLLMSRGKPRPLVIQTIKDRDDKYGRLLARVWVVSTGKEVGPEMVRLGHGLPWDGTGGHPDQPGHEMRDPDA